MGTVSYMYAETCVYTERLRILDMHNSHRWQVHHTEQFCFLKMRFSLKPVNTS